MLSMFSAVMSGIYSACVVQNRIIMICARKFGCDKNVYVHLDLRHANNKSGSLQL